MAKRSKSGADGPPRVGGVRPSQLTYSYGVGAVMDLPNFSVIVAGLDDWKTDNASVIAEDRLVDAVRALVGPTVRVLRAAPWIAETRSVFDDWARVGVPVLPFPRWMRCTACDRLASIDATFVIKTNPFRPDHVVYRHAQCPKRGNKPARAVPARFVTACPNGHIDEFPWIEFTHQKTGVCDAPILTVKDFGSGGRSTDVAISCACGAKNSMVAAFGRGADAVMPKCRGRHAHLRRFDAGCTHGLRAMLLGSSNGWFPVTRAALSIPRGLPPIDEAVAEVWHVLDAPAAPVTSLETLKTLIVLVAELQRVRAYDPVDVMTAIETRRAGLNAPPGPVDLLLPEWEALSRPDLVEPSRDFKVGRVGSLTRAPGIVSVAPVERLRQVVALCGFTRIDAPEPSMSGDQPVTAIAPLWRTPQDWVPANEVRGEGIFIRLDDERLAAWEEENDEAKEFVTEFNDAVATWRKHRNLDPSSGWPGPRYLLLHSLSHALLNVFALECGYPAASIRERIYSRVGNESMAGILLYTAAPDSDGTLGGLVALAKPDTFERLLFDALGRAHMCASDPMCSAHVPDARHGLHGAACHACLFVPETSCEGGNRFLDRSTLRETLSARDNAFPFEP